MLKEMPKMKIEKEAFNDGYEAKVDNQRFEQENYYLPGQIIIF